MHDLCQPDSAPAAGDHGYLAAVLENAVDGIIAIGPRGRIRAFNPAAERIFGYKSADVIGRNVNVLMPEPYRSGHDRYLENYLSTGEAKIIGLGRELTGQRSDGTVFPMELGVSEVEVAEEHFFVGIVRDISERKAAEQALLDKAAHLNAVMNTVIDGLITIDENGTISSFNAAAERIFGYTESEAIGRNVKFLMPEPYQSAHDSYLSHYRQTGRKSIIGVGREVAARRKDGAAFPIDLAVSEMVLKGRRMFVGIVRDITARKEVERERLKLIANLERSNQELDDFAYIASHDLKEPLRGLFNNSLFLKEDYANILDAAGVKRLDRMCYLSQRMEKLIDDLLYFSRLGRQDLAWQATDLDVVVRDVWDQLEAAKADHVRLHMEAPLPSVACDGVRIGEVFRNLFTNAIKYNKGPEVVVEVGCLVPKAGGPVYFVRDNGIGIAQEFQRDVFTMFKRLNAENDDARGAGVGLTFAKKIVERHGGSIWLESELGRGTTFYFTIQEGGKGHGTAGTTATG
jgi:two-component system, LuxR family, sensor kinase FixL